MTAFQALRVAVIGNGDRNEFLPIKSAIADLTEVILFHDLSAVDRQVGYDLLFLLESRPGEYGEREILEYRKKMPLCRMVLIAGALAEGEKRTGRVPDGLFRYYTWQQHSMIRELDRFLHHRNSLWAGPLTMTPEEIVLQQTDTFRDILRDVFAREKKVAIVSADEAFKKLLEDLCRQEHGRIVAEKDVPDLVILDETGLSTEDLIEKLHRQRLGNRHVHLWVFGNASRWDETKRLHENGADYVFAKPFF